MRRIAQRVAAHGPMRSTIALLLRDGTRVETAREVLLLRA